MTKRVGIIGYPVGHSISPAFQQAALDYLKLDVRYERWQTEPRQLKKVVEGLRVPSVLGANITVPYKEQVIPLLDEVEEMALSIGAVNTILNKGGKLTGHNTDAYGFIRALKEDGGFEPEGKRGVLLGAGGAGRAVGFALVKAGVAALTLVDLNKGRADKLAFSLRASLSSVSSLHSADEGVASTVARCHLLVNCTPLGTRHTPGEKESPLPGEVIPKDILVFDLVYNPPETPFILEARRAGARTLGGLPMLVYQGAAAFELWTGLGAPLDIMSDAAKKVLRI